MFLINTLITIHFIFVNRRCYHISVPTIKKDYVKTFNFIFYSCTLIVMPLMVFALIRLKKRVLKIEQDRKRRERGRERRERERIWQSCVT